ncbi:hypothetical protein [Fulvivirga sediminis]|uniref:Uncharacterized protein n=1 Tax=Fulvivirga sediminis TaxID=2803949 RepID=A0A937K343_9BACT|nr:hypothetical protein [Fulvivirga sediminis]MBL3659020.1 hypothetical protein [Fulvivirga sediminis]
MKRLRIDIKKVQPRTGSKWIDYPLIGILILIGLCLLPLLIVFWIFGILINLLNPNKSIQFENNWNKIITGTNQSISYKWVNVDDMPEYVYKYFDTQPLLMFNTNPHLEFFDGYFTDFKVERDDGLFIQKVIRNDETKEIKALPLYFFNYSTLDIKEIKDLKGYEIDSKGNPNDFLVSAIGEEGELEIRLIKE